MQAELLRLCETSLPKAAGTEITDTVQEEVKCSQSSLFFGQSEHTKDLIHKRRRRRRRKKETVLERHAGIFRRPEQILVAIWGSSGVKKP